MFAELIALSDLMLAQATGEYGPWTNPINILQGLVVAAGSIGVLLGLAVIASAGANSERIKFGVHLIEGAGAGLFLGLMAEPIYGLLGKLVMGL